MGIKLFLFLIQDIYEDSERLRNDINNDVEILKGVGFDVEVISLKNILVILKN